ncbi:MAG: VOC family protein [Rhizomicrobium sp.]
MIIGAHIMLQSTNDKADMAFLTDVLKLQSINAGGGYVIFGIPPAEMSIHGSDRNDVHQLYFMCEEIAAFTGDMTRHGIAFSTPVRQSWGTVTEITLPGGGKLGVYQPRHARPEPVGAKPVAEKKSRRPANKLAKKAAKKTVTPARPAKKKTRAAKKRPARR